MKLTRRRIVVVVSLLIIATVIINIIVLVKKSKHSAPMPSGHIPTGYLSVSVPMPSDTIPSGPIPAGGLMVGLFQLAPPPGGGLGICKSVSKAKGLEASSIILNLEPNTNPALKMSYRYTGGSYNFIANIVGFYIINGQLDKMLDGLMLIVELPNDPGLLSLLKSHNITVNPSKLYNVSSTGSTVSLNNQIYEQTYMSPSLDPITIETTDGYKICPVYNTNIRSFPITLQPIQYYENIVDRLKQTLG